MRMFNEKGFVFHAEYLIVITAVLAGLLIAKPKIQLAATNMLTHIVGEIEDMVDNVTFGG